MTIFEFFIVILDTIVSANISLFINVILQMHLHHTGKEIISLRSIV